MPAREPPGRRRGQPRAWGWQLCAVAAAVAALIPGAAAFHHPGGGAAVARPPARLAAAPRNNDNDEALLSRRELLLPALLCLGSGISILTNGIRDERAYDAAHKALFGAIEDPSFRRILEVGIGEAPNVPYYPTGSAVTGIDPYLKRDALAVAQSKAKARGVELTIQEAAAEALPFADGSFDAAVSTLVFCTVHDPAKALREVSRVLRPGGRFIFIEHIIGEEGSFLRKQHQALDGLQQLLAEGCHLTRETDRLFVGSADGGGGQGLFSRLERLEYLEQGSKWPIVRQVAGVLVK